MNEKLINEFIDYLRFEKKYSENTIDSYKRDLKKTNNYLKKEFTNLTKKDIENYIQKLSKEESTTSISRYISTLKRLLQIFRTK